MDRPKKRQKVAILGGGIGGLATAFELTSQPDWQDRFEITLHQIGWRLGGKCASSRGPNERIEEHGIHGFTGFYYNAVPFLAACYAALKQLPPGIPPGSPLDGFEKAFSPSRYMLAWERTDTGLTKWSQMLPVIQSAFLPNFPTDPRADLYNALNALTVGLEQPPPAGGPAPQPPAWLLALIAFLAQATALAKAKDHAGLGACLATEWPPSPMGTGQSLKASLLAAGAQSTEIRRLFIVLDFALTLIRGYIARDVATAGFDSLDDQNWSDWLQAQGVDPLTFASPIPIATINITYQYPQGDTSRAPRMAAGTFLQWSLLSIGCLGEAVLFFSAGMGEAVIAPLYEVLRRRGVKFEFFHKVEALRLSPDASRVEAVEIAVQANPLDPARPYEPLYTFKGLPCWPKTPFHDQLAEGDLLKSENIDLESYWSHWKAPRRLRLEAGKDFDTVVFAISMGAIPHICADLIKARPDTWGAMVDALPTVQTQNLQVWFSKDMYDLGWNPEFPGGANATFQGTDTAVSATFVNPPNGMAEFRHLIPLEGWPADCTPKSLWYFCGPMADDIPAAPFDDHGYPARQRERVRFQFIQYMQSALGWVLPNATVSRQHPPGDPLGLDFSLLVDGKPAPDGGDEAAMSVGRIDTQFYLANINPTERYVMSPPGSTRHRMKAGQTGFSNLMVAGDWIYTGLNIGSVEGAVMSGKLASHAVSGSPSLASIIGYTATTT